MPEPVADRHTHWYDFAVLRRVPILLGLTALAGGLTCAAAYATSSQGDQNPELLVKVSVTPTHASGSATITATASITNQTGHRLKNVEIDTTFITPSDETDEGSLGGLAAGRTVSITYHRKVSRFGPGVYSLRVRASDSNGRSHAAAHATGQ
jgi:hypothetical protein